MAAWLKNLLSDDNESGTNGVLKIQIVLLLALCVALHLGFYSLRVWRETAEANQLTTTLRGWDGFAWYVWMLAAPVMLVMVRRFPLTRAKFSQNLTWILLGSFALYLIMAHLRYFARVLPDWWSGDVSRRFIADNYGYNTFSLWPVDLLTYCCFFGLTFSLNYHFKYRQRADEAIKLELKAARLESELSRAELAALRGQLHPHFLFNSFNALATLVRQKKNDDAVEIIAQLSGLLRLAIDRIGFQEVTLDQELDFIERYLALERVRFGDKLKIEMAIDPATRDVLVPNIMLQPLVENAIKHGISKQVAVGVVRISASRVEGRLHLEILNDGPRPEAAHQNIFIDGAPSSTGIGEANTRARLEKLFGPNYRLDRRMRPEGGAMVTLDLPWRLTPVSKTSYEKNPHANRR